MQLETNASARTMDFTSIEKMLEKPKALLEELKDMQY
jgi:hypothetical protein